MPDQPFDLSTLMQRSRTARAEIATDSRLSEATKQLLDVQYAQHERAATMRHFGVDFEAVMRVVYNILP